MPTEVTPSTVATTSAPGPEPRPKPSAEASTSATRTQKSASVAPSATSSTGRASNKSKGCVLPEPGAPTRRGPRGATAQSADWLGPNDRCKVPEGYRPWSWSILRRVRGLRERVVIFTVDGGLNVGVTHAGLDVLRDYGVRATYFLTTGLLAKADGGRDLVQRIATEGHEIANHSVTHPKLTELSDEKVREEIADADAWLAEAVGYSPRPFFRPPFLDRDDRTDGITRDLCYRPVWFTVYTKDDTAGVTADDISRAVLCDDEDDKPRKIKSGSIFMFHASQKETVKAWPVIITGLRERGFRFMTLSEAMLAREKKKPKKKRKRRQKK